MVAPGHGLGGLQMGEPGHDPVRPGIGLRQEGAHQGLDPRNRRIALIADPQAEIHRHLIIAAAGGVQPPGGFADQLFQPRLHIHVDVFQIGAKPESACFNL